jgi:uncharacterized membrane protein YgdD (TMEM256/DUF423 family)
MPGSAIHRWVFWGGLCCALSVVAGAFGAHALASRLDVRSLQLWETAARYLMYGGLGQLAAGLLASPLPSAPAPGPTGGPAPGPPSTPAPGLPSATQPGLPPIVALAAPGSAPRRLAWAGGALLAGSALFSSTVGALALGGPRWLGAVTPLGGLLMIAGFLLLAAAGVSRR